MKIKLFLALSVLAMSMQSYTINLSDLSIADQRDLTNKALKVYDELTGQRLVPYTLHRPLKLESTLTNQQIQQMRERVEGKPYVLPRSTNWLNRAKSEQVQQLTSRQTSADFDQAVKALHAQTKVEANLRKGAMNFLQQQDKAQVYVNIQSEQKMHQAAVSAFENEGGRFAQNIKPISGSSFFSKTKTFVKNPKVALAATVATVTTAGAYAGYNYLNQQPVAVENVETDAQAFNGIQYDYAYDHDDDEPKPPSFVKLHPYIAGTVAAAAVAGIGYGAYKLAQKYFGKAANQKHVQFEEPKKDEVKQARKIATPVRRNVKRVIHRRR